MEGREEVTMDGKTRITWVLRLPQNPRSTRSQRVTADVSEQAGASCGTLLSAAAEPACAASGPRLAETR